MFKFETCNCGPRVGGCGVDELASRRKRLVSGGLWKVPTEWWSEMTVLFSGNYSS